IIAGDDDKHLEAAGKENVGRKKALEAAEAVGGKAVFPVFEPGERDANPRAFTDFNDLAVKSKFGLEAVKSQVGAAVSRQIELKSAAMEKVKTRERQEKQREGKEIARI
ncbi:MAG: DNA primase, partial [Planctomycetota bacterium]|nr:DNA primase [Planctomycetota bacterium]